MEINKHEIKKIVDDSVNNSIEKFSGIVNNGFEEQAKVFRDGLKQEIEKVDQKIEKVYKKVEKVDQKVERVENKVEESERNILDSNEKIVTELKTIRQEQVANVGAHDRIQENIDDHNFRIKKLELKAI